MSLLNTRATYGTVSKILHWVMMLMLLMSLSGGLAYTRLQLPGLSQSGHEIFGKAILALAVLRLALRLIAGTPAPNPHHALWERKLADLIHWALYVILFAYPLTGWLMVSAGDFSETGRLPEWIAPFGLADFYFTLHFSLKWVLLGLVGLHVAGALKHAILDRDGTLRRMGFGRSS